MTARLRSVIRSLLLASAIAGLVITSALAVEPDEILDDPALEQRAREISSELRCMVCQNQSIDDSNAELARDLRLIVRERLVDGDTNEEVYDYVVSRYGEFVLLRPRLSLQTIVLWGAPLIVMALGAFAIAAFLRNREPLSAGAKLSDSEAAELERILKERKRVG